MYRAEVHEYEVRCCETKKHYHNNAVSECNGDQGSMFNIINTLFHRSSACPLPVAEPGTDLVPEFSQFFENKIVKIHNQL